MAKQEKSRNIITGKQIKFSEISTVELLDHNSFVAKFKAVYYTKGTDF